MTVPTDISALSTTRDSNVSPVASDNVFPELDDHIRALQSFVASIYQNTATNGWVSPYATAADFASTASTALGDALVGVKREESGAVAQTLHLWIQRSRICVGDFAGFTGDGIANDATAWRAAAAAAEGKILVGVPDTICLVQDEIILPTGCWTDLNGSEIRFDVTGAKYGFKMGSGTVVCNGTIKHINTTNEAGVNGSHRSCVTVGSFNAGPGDGDQNVVIENLTMRTSRPNGQCVSIYSDSYNVTVRNVQLFDDNGAKNGIAAHWSSDDGGAPPSGTKHPSGIIIEHVEATDFDVGVYMSSAHNVTVRNSRFIDCEKGVEAYRGDYSNSYASADDAQCVGKGIVIEQNVIRGATIGIEIDGIEGLTAAQNIMGVTVRDNLIFGRTAGASTDRGIYIRGTSRATIHDNEIAYFEGYGVDFAGESDNISVRDNSIHDNNQGGIWSRGTDTITDIVIEANKLYSNAASNASSDKPHINIAALCKRWRLSNNEFGASGETANVSILLTPGTHEPVLHNNHTAYLAGGGYAYRVSGATTPATTASMRMDARGNTAASGLTLWDGSPMSELFGPLGNLCAYDTAAPTAGVWINGDRVERSTRTSGQPKAWSCTVAGGAASGTRADTTAYASGVFVTWSTGTTAWECTTAGTSAGSAPSIVGKVVGDTVTDGTVVWTMRSLTTATFTSEGNL